MSSLRMKRRIVNGARKKLGLLLKKNLAYVFALTCAYFYSNLVVSVSGTIFDCFALVMFDADREDIRKTSYSAYSSS